MSEEIMAKRTILIFNRGYLPGKKLGGPVTSIQNFCDAFNSEYSIKNTCRIFCKILKTEHNYHYISRVLNPKAGSRSKVHNRNHKKRCCKQKKHSLQYCNKSHRNCKMIPCINKSAYSKEKLPQSFYIKNFWYKIEENVNWSEAVFYKFAGPYHKAQVPVVVKKAL